eukprot:TRINITY_DN19187_c0_g1_i2.p1 TRINITY_DN19187_c0_g1~~TRINITY_DN19187_c0_g1_i2.p1  ORF type:complete len:939 (+),score=120.90 TRINITY_DN19187_c0_g1_i2:53-2869(+)
MGRLARSGLLALLFKTAWSAVLLREWLQNLQLELPSFQIPKTASGLPFELNVTGGTCRGLHISELRLPQASGGPQSVDLTVETELDINCTLRTDIPALQSRPCTLEVVTAASAASIQLHISSQAGLPEKIAASCTLSPDITDLRFQGRTMVCETLRLAERSLRTLINNFASRFVCGGAGRWLSTHLTQGASHLRDVVTPFLRPAAALPEPQTPDDALDLRHSLWEGPLGHTLRSFMKEVGHTDNMTRWNDILEFLLRDTGLASANGLVRLPVTGLGIELRLPNTSGLLVNLTLQNAWLRNLDSFRVLDLSFLGEQTIRMQGGLSPSAGALAAAALLLPSDSAEIQLQGLQFRLKQKVSLSPARISAHVDTQVSGDALVYAALNASAMRRLQLDQLQRLGCSPEFMVFRGGCPSSLLEARMNPQVDRLKALLPELGPGDLESQILAVGLEIFSALGTTFGAKAAQVVDGFISSSGRTAVNSRLQKNLRTVHQCPRSNFSSGEIHAVDDPARCVTGVLLGMMVVFLAATFLCGSCWKGPSSQQELLASGPSPEESSHRRLGLGWDPQVSPCLRWGIVSGILGTIAMFIVASVTPGVLVTGYFEASGMTFETPDIAQLSMDNSLSQMLSVGSYFVFFAMVLFSVVWPHVKLLFMLYIWLAPVKLSRRGPLLVFLDKIGKWSLTDNFILFLFVVLFWISWSGQDVVGGGSASFRLKCSPAIELDTFLGATILSLILGHAMLWVHRSCDSDDASGSSSASATPSRARRLRMSFASASCLALMFVAFRAHIVEVTDQDTTKRYSILGILSCLGFQGSFYLQFSMAAFVLVIPVIHFLLITIMYAYPFQPKSRQRFQRACQTMNAWSALDVFFVAYLAAVIGGEKYGITQFVQLIIYQQNVAPLCDGLKGVGIECLQLQLAMLPGAALVAAAIAACYVASTFAVL